MKKFLLPLTCVSLLTISEAVPSAEDLIQQLVAQDPNQIAETSSSWESHLSPGDSSVDRSSPEYAEAWTAAFGQWMATKSYDSEGEDLAYYFPGPAAWPVLQGILAEQDEDTSAPINFQLAIAQGNYAAASGFLEKSEKSTKPVNSLLRLIARPSQSRDEQAARFWFLKTADFIRSTPVFPKKPWRNCLLFSGRIVKDTFRCGDSRSLIWPRSLGMRRLRLS
jgi:hypothetical protein